MKTAHRWRDVPNHARQPSSHANRFDVFAGSPERSRSPKQPQGLAPVGSLFKARPTVEATHDATRSVVNVASAEPQNTSRATMPEESQTSTQPQERHRSIASDHIPRAPLSLWDYLKVELAATDSDEAHDFKRERVKNFLILPNALERTLMFGFVVCLDSFLYIFTILPLRFLQSLLSASRRLARPTLKSSEKVDLLKGGLILMTCIVLNRLDASRVYHTIRGQAAIKLYVLYNVLEIGDKLFCALGQDILDCLFSKSTFGRKEDGTRRHVRPAAFLILAVIYNVLHTILLFYQLVTLNVTVNSFSNALMTLLLSNQFVEIKGSVFKKFEKEGLFQITCADMVERFQLFIMLLIIGLRNTFEMTPDTAVGVVSSITGPLLTVLVSEVLVDWLKHAFITKFNHVRPTIYARFTDVLCRDYVKSGSIGDGRNSFVDQSPAISRRIGLPVLPLVCLTIRSVGQIVSMVRDHSTEAEVMDASSVWDSNLVTSICIALIAIMVFMTLVIIKLSIGVALINFAHGRYSSMSLRESQESQLEAERKRKDVYKGLVELDGDTKMILNNRQDNLKGEEGGRGLLGLERYSMISKRIW